MTVEAEGLAQYGQYLQTNYLILRSFGIEAKAQAMRERGDDGRTA